MKAIVTPKGEIPIPGPIRDQLGIKPGDTLDLTVKNGAILARKSEYREALDQLFGILGTKKTSDEILDELRGKPDIR